MNYPNLYQPNDQLIKLVLEFEAHICEKAKVGEVTKGM